MKDFKKYGLTATQSSGKTTLINALSKLQQFESFDCVTERTSYLKNSVGVLLNDDSGLISQYIFMGERARELFEKCNTFCDRTVYDVCAYTLSSKTISEEDKYSFVQGCIPLMKQYDCIFYVDPIGVNIEDNGLRHTGDSYRKLIDETIKDLLETYPPQKLIILSGTTEKRIEDVLKATYL